MSDLTDDQVRALLKKAGPGPWDVDGPVWNRTVWRSSENRVCFMAHSNGLDDDRDMATSRLVAAAPDLARALLQARADAAAAQATLEKRNEEIALERDISAELSAKLHAIGFIDAPTEPGSFIGDIWFGHSIKRTLGTHRWTGSEWAALPSEMDAVLDLLAEARAEIATLKGAYNG